MPAQFRPFSDLPAPEKRRRNLPHWEAPGATYFLTFRLADSIPAGALHELELRATAWLRAHNCADRRDVWTLPVAAQADFRRVIRSEEERWLDAGEGRCVLRDAACRAVLVETLQYFDGTRYALDDYVIMPNHVHALILPLEEWSLSKILGTWKQYSSMRINERQRQAGGLWQKETFDHIVRDIQKLEECRRYIAANPIKAKLKASEYHLGRGSGIVS
jgi:type I restriction enzyme R subunit